MAQILVAEDDAALRLLYTIWLESAGHQVTAVADGRDALVLIQRRLPDLAVLDLEMPFVDGLAVSRYLHGLAPEVPILVVTALDDARASAEEAGAGGTLMKPCDRDQLVAAVDLLHVRHAGEERAAQVAGVGLRVDPDAVGAGIRLE